MDGYKLFGILSVIIGMLSLPLGVSSLGVMVASFALVISWVAAVSKYYYYSIITMAITVIVICWMSPIQIIPKSSELICRLGHLNQMNIPKHSKAYVAEQGINENIICWRTQKAPPNAAELKQFRSIWLTLIVFYGITLVCLYTGIRKHYYALKSTP